MLDILFTIVIVLMFILCFVLHRRCRDLQRKIDRIYDFLEKEKTSDAALDDHEK